MDNQSYSVADLSSTTQLPRRTIRYYVQIGLIPPPHGSGKGARYGIGHLERLLKIRRLQTEGFSLERISQLLDEPTHAPAGPVAGDLRVVTRLTVAPGITLELDPEVAGLSPEQMRAFARECMKSFVALCQGDKND